MISRSDSAQAVLKERFLRKDRAGRYENIESCLMRTARFVARAEPTSKWRKECTRTVFEMMIDGRFLPNSPTLVNAGKSGGQLSACFVLPVYGEGTTFLKTISEAVSVQISGGGTGFNFNGVGRVKTESGPEAWIHALDAVTNTIKQSGVRRGANMAVVGMDHPNILKFIRWKLNEGRGRNFNLSVGSSQEDAAELSRQQQHIGMWEEIASAAWSCGDPGVVFLDRVNMFNPTPQAGIIAATNPCGEQPLLSYESCNLGSLNIAKYVDSNAAVGNEFAWSKLESDVVWAVRFLDLVIDATAFPLKEIEIATKKSRKIGLGIMGFADALLLLNVKYGSLESIVWAERIMSFVDRVAKQASIALAKEKGSFPLFRGSLWSRLGYPKLRNSAEQCGENRHKGAETHHCVLRVV
jgi:ribonucleoside-diphosphate reductase alpha chain